MLQNTQRKARAPWRVWLPIILALVVAVVGVVLFISSFHNSISRPVKLSALATQQVTPFGEDVLYYDGMVLHCVTGSGSHRWSFQVGQYASFHTNGRRVVAWSANQLYILGRDGQPTFNDRMSEQIQFVRMGAQYVAAFVGSRDSGTVYVLDINGKSVDSMPVDTQTLLDIGFFADPEMMWMMGLDTSGTVPSVIMQTYRPGTLATGNVVLGEQLTYKVYFHNGLLYIADTRQIRAFDYKIKQDVNVAPTLIYGWFLADTRQMGRDMAQLLVPTPQMDGTLHATDLRVLTGGKDRVLHLPAACFGAALGSKSVYGFSANYVYACGYGENTFRAYALPVFATRLLGITPGNRAVISAGSDVYLVQLPE